MLLPRRKFLGGMGVLAAALRTPVSGRVGCVEIGVCAGAVDFGDAVRYGFDYFEPNASEIAAMGEAQFGKFRARVLESPIRCKSFRILFHNMRVVGEDVNEGEVERYVDQTLGRCRQLGGEVMVYGSGASRNVPAGFSRDRAWEQIRDFLRMAGDMARRHQMVIGIEALKRPDSNIINKSAESLRLVHELNHPNVKMIVDYYHMSHENEDPEIIWEARQEIVHLHFANPAGRRWPLSVSEDPGYRPFFEQVRRIRYRRGLSIEGVGTFTADAAASLRFFAEMLG
ncbi:MAG: sugar phosphate isomerase/epimerase family protein [Bryobacteraceae bacterium]